MLLLLVSLYHQLTTGTNQHYDTHDPHVPMSWYKPTVSLKREFNIYNFVYYAIHLPFFFNNVLYNLLRLQFPQRPGWYTNRVSMSQVSMSLYEPCGVGENAATFRLWGYHYLISAQQWKWKQEPTYVVLVLVVNRIIWHNLIK